LYRNFINIAFYSLFGVSVVVLFKFFLSFSLKVFYCSDENEHLGTNGNWKGFRRRLKHLQKACVLFTKSRFVVSMRNVRVCDVDFIVYLW